MSAFKAPAVNTQDLINRILQLKQITERLEEQNCELKDYNKQLETQIMAIPFIRQQKKKDKAKVNLLKFFKTFLGQLHIYMNIKDKELSNNKDKIIMTVLYLYRAVFDWFNIYLQNYYKRDEVDQNNNMLKIIDSYNIFIQILKITFREVEKQNVAAQQLHHIQ
ncbi:conserved hypothetical protein [Coccidioides posadasii str. Silveira]|uniref:DUF4939 domain-containing protein n=1 Tax=Coccidioides posadasii (strain RMSCC 757 / Silveira) TaxID=443226 RepID=E9D0G6_COCPS|nr:conserved hypothetical protein [Coccidioides posadasii str. Silveira]